MDIGVATIEIYPNTQAATLPAAPTISEPHEQIEELKEPNNIAGQDEVLDELIIQASTKSDVKKPLPPSLKEVPTETSQIVIDNQTPPSLVSKKRLEDDLPQ